MPEKTAGFGAGVPVEPLSDLEEPAFGRFDSRPSRRSWISRTEAIMA
jgi:hypothetical protein